MLVYDSKHPSDRPAHFVVLDWKAGAISGIRDCLFASFIEGADWVRRDASRVLFSP